MPTPSPGDERVSVGDGASRGAPDGARSGSPSALASGDDGASGGVRGWLRRHVGGAPPTLDERCWGEPFESSEVLAPLSTDERARLRALAERFVATRRFECAGGLVLDDAMRARVALEACLPVLELGLEGYRRARSVLLYPAGFLVEQSWTDEAGVEHAREAELVGEAWEGGPVILAWDDVAAPLSGTNVVVHEFAHVLDALNGRTNGFPPLGDAALARRWPLAFGAAYADHVARVERGDEAFLDDYGAEDEAEFFAVAVETFFTWPENVAEGYPAVYDVLREYFRQDPLERLAATG